MKIRIWKLSFLLCFLFVSHSFYSQSTYYPGSSWQTKTATEVGMSSEKLKSAVSFALNNENKVERDLRIANIKAFGREPNYRILGPMKKRGKPAGLIIKNGYIVAQWGDINRVDMTFSVTKSYLSTVAGLAVDEKLIKNVDDAVKNYVTDDTFEGPHNSKVTWRHLLNQSSDWSGCQFDICDWADRPPRRGTIDDWKNRKLYEPGTHYKYNDVRVNLLAYSLLQVWRKPLPMILKEKIMDPIGASTTWRWHGYKNSFVNVDGIMMQSVSGGGHFGGGIFINTLDHARFGLLFLRKGKWNGKQLISEDWITAARKPSFANKNYGFMWWLNEKQSLKGLSKNIYSARGFGGNFIVIDEEHDLVVVTRWLDSSKLGDFMKKVIDAVN
ncbi:serine hydrolase domain-containing protein [Pseudotenacibaculum haliotis]|uniref:Serine hydrolase domain-containing protein n=1 Tax=Pseudotenacibaculum haliotis TaxID=1862138 RepID=A0ABW5LSR4_9FLAO